MNHLEYTRPRLDKQFSFMRKLIPKERLHHPLLKILSLNLLLKVMSVSNTQKEIRWLEKTYNKIRARANDKEKGK